MSAYKEGDLVEATKGERVVRDRVVRGASPIFGGRLYLGEPTLIMGNSLDGLKAEGYAFEAIERMPEPLPTEQGVYASTRTDYGTLRPYYLDGRGVWHELDDSGPVVVTREEVREFAPLEPLAATS